MKLLLTRYVTTVLIIITVPLTESKMLGESDRERKLHDTCEKHCALPEK